MGLMVTLGIDTSFNTFLVIFGRASACQPIANDGMTPPYLADVCVATSSPNIRPSLLL